LLRLVLRFTYAGLKTGATRTNKKSVSLTTISPLTT